MRSRASIALSGAVIAALSLTACVPNNVAGSALGVSVTDDTCAVSASSAPSGTIAFEITNSGTDLNEFYVLGDDQLRVVAEKENLTPGQTITYVTQLDPGTYYTACKFRLTGEPIGMAELTITGDAVVTSADEQELVDEAVASYVSYIESQVAELVPQVSAFTAAYASGDDETARALFPLARVSYERIEPTAEAFGDLDPKIDYREVNAVAEGLEWTGFHRIEKDLWPPSPGDLNADGTSAFLDWAPSTTQQRQAFADALNADVNQLSELVNADDFTVTIDDISNGAIALLDEVAVGKITGEEDWWSHTDLYDFLANVEGARVAFGTVEKLTASTGAEGAALTEEIAAEFAALEALLGTYGSFEAGFTPYDQVTAAQRKELSDQVNSLAEPLSMLTQTLLSQPE